MGNGVSAWPEDRSRSRNAIAKARNARKSSNLPRGLEKPRPKIDLVPEAPNSQESSPRIPSRTKPETSPELWRMNHATKSSKPLSLSVGKVLRCSGSMT